MTNYPYLQKAIDNLEDDNVHIDFMDVWSLFNFKCDCNMCVEYLDGLSKS